jgi:tetratricopeptide (TPR) repeat protein
MKTAFSQLAFACLVFSMAHAQVNLFDVANAGDVLFEELFQSDTIAFEWKMSGMAQANLNEGINQYKDEKFGVAIELLTNVVKQEPELWMSYYYRALCYKKLRQYTEAEKDLKQCLVLNKSLLLCYLELGKIHVLNGKPNESEKNYEKYIDLNPTDPKGQYLLAGNYFIYKNPAKAKKALEKCLEIDSKYAPAYMKLGLLELSQDKQISSLEKFEKALEIDSVNSLALLFHGIFSADKVPKQSLRDFSKLIRLYPANHNFRLMRGFLLVEQKDFENAFRDLHKVIQERQINEGAFRGQQSYLDKQIDLQYAGYYVISHIYGMPDGLAEQVKKGFCLLCVGKDEDAIRTFNPLHHQDTTAVTRFLTALGNERLGKHVTAFQLYDKALKFDNDLLDAHKKRGTYLMELKNYAGALKDFNEMLRINSENHAAHKFKAIALYNLKNYEEAEKSFTKHLASDSTDKDGFIYRGDCYRALGDSLSSLYDFIRGDALNYESLDFLIRRHYKDEGFDRINHELYALLPKKKISQLQVKALQLRTVILKKDWDRVSVDSDKLIEESKKNFDMQMQSFGIVAKGIRAYQKGETDEAIKLFNKALRIDPNSGTAFLERGKLYRLSNDEKAARKDFAKAKELGYSL